MECEKAHIFIVSWEPVGEAPLLRLVVLMLRLGRRGRGVGMAFFWGDGELGEGDGRLMIDERGESGGLV